MAAGGGHLFLSDAANHRIVRLDPATGAVTATWGDRGAFPGMFESPAQLAWDGSALLVTDTLNHRVVGRFDASGKPLDQWGMHAVRPREGQGKIHYPSGTSVSPDGVIAVVSEPFERRVQLFTEELPPDPAKPRLTALPANEGLASHFSSEVAIDGQTLVVYEPESASALVFDMRNEPPIHVTTIGGPGMRARASSVRSPRSWWMKRPTAFTLPTRSAASSRSSRCAATVRHRTSTHSWRGWWRRCRWATPPPSQPRTRAGPRASGRWTCAAVQAAAS